MKRVDRREAARGEAVADDLAAGVHRARVAARNAEGAEVDHPAPLRPRERMRLGVAPRGAAEPYDLAAAVHRGGVAVAVATEGAEVDHPALLRPRERMRLGARGAAGPDHLA